MVVKKGGQRESFDRYKILNGLKKACEKRPVSVVEMEDVVKAIETRLLELGHKEVSSQTIGEMVIERLHALDQVAYVRFASVYREFSDVREFMDALRSLVTSGGVKHASGEPNPAVLQNVLPIRGKRIIGTLDAVREAGGSRERDSSKQQDLFRAPGNNNITNGDKDE